MSDWYASAPPCWASSMIGPTSSTPICRASHPWAPLSWPSPSTSPCGEAPAAAACYGAFRSSQPLHTLGQRCGLQPVCGAVRAADGGDAMPCRTYAMPYAMHHATSYGDLPQPHVMSALPCPADPCPCNAMQCHAGVAWCPAAAGAHKGRTQRQRSSTIGGCSRASRVPHLLPRASAALLPSWAAAHLQSAAGFCSCSRDFTPAEQQLGLHRSVLNFVSGAALRSVARPSWNGLRLLACLGAGACRSVAGFDLLLTPPSLPPPPPISGR